MKAQRRFNRLLLAGGSVCLLVVFALSSFLSPAPFAPTARAQPIAVGLVPDGPLNDQAFNWNSYQGLRRAEEELGVAGTVYTPTLGFDEALGRCVADGNDLCLAVGFAAGDATRDAANANPGTDFAIVDLSYETYPDNLRGIVFAADQGAYLAGTLAALMTDSDVLGVIGGLPIPPVDDFIYGFRNGARCANISATVLISYTYDFMNPDLGAQYARAMMDAGADVIFAPAGGTAAGAVLTATQSGVWGIGVDVDFYYTVFASGTVPGSDRLLTSALKRLDNAVFQTIADVVSGTFTPGTRRYDLAEDGVGIAPFHDADPFVPQPVRDHLELVRQGLVGGTIDPGDPCGAQATVLDSILWEVDAAEIEAPNGGLYKVDFSNIEDGVLTGTGNISQDPLFVGGGDYHLRAGSPCIDVGTAAGAPAYDWEGDPRPFGGGVDMGADEWWVRLGVSLGADSAARSGAPGAAVTYTLVLTNTGEYTDSYDLAAGGVWTPTLSLGTAGPLAPGAGLTLTLTVSVPADASGGAMDTTAVTATSTLETSTRASILVTTTARQVEFRVYLPLVLRGYGR